MESTVKEKKRERGREFYEFRVVENPKIIINDRF